MKKDFIAPILAMSLICLVMTGALALVNNVTHPIIEDGATQRANEAMGTLIPLADGFTLMEGSQTDHFSPAIREAYQTTNQVGYIFIVTTRGFGGEMQIMIGLCDFGHFYGSTVLSHNETVSFANRVFAIRDELKAEGRNFLYIDAISGATETFEAYRSALEIAFEAFEKLGGGER